MKKFLIFSLTLVVIAAWLVSPLKVLAQDATPTEEPTAAPTDTPTDIPTDTPSVEPTVTPTDAPTELPGQNPPDANVVLLDNAGNVVPADAPQAAEIFATGDPMFCPAGAAFGASTCTSFTTLENALTFAASKSSGTIYVESSYTSPTTNMLSVNGNLFGANTLLTIAGGYCFDKSNVTCDYGTNGPKTTLVQPVEITGWGTGTRTSSLTLLDFIIQPDLSGLSTPSVVVHDTNNVTIKDTNINDNSAADALVIASSGKITLDNVAIHESGIGNGILLGNTSNVVINNTYIDEASTSDNVASDNGIFVGGGSNLTIKNSSIYVTAAGGSTPSSNNGIFVTGTNGLTLNNVYLSATGSNESSYDSGNGLVVAGARNITIKNLTAENNLNRGAFFTATGNGETLAITKSSFNGNDSDGIVISEHYGNVNLTDVTASDNRGNGLKASYILGTTTILDSDFNYNGIDSYDPYWQVGPGSGLKFTYIQGAIKLVNTNAYDNAGDGFQAMDVGIPGLGLTTADELPVGNGNISITNGYFNYNGGSYLWDYQSDCYYDGSGECDSLPTGTGISTSFVLGNTTLTGVQGDDNFGNGFLSMLSLGNLNISGSEFNYNGYWGGYGSPANNPVQNSIFPFEMEYGMGIYDAFRMGNVFLNNVEANENSSTGAIIGMPPYYGGFEGMFSTGDVTVKNSSFDENDDGGLMVSSSGLTSIYSTHAYDNYGDGVNLWSLGSVYVDGLVSEGNWGDGIHIEGNFIPAAPPMGEVTPIRGVDATICNSVFAGNYEEGVDYFAGGTLTLANNQIYDNGGWNGEVYIADPGVVVEMGPEFCMPATGQVQVGVGPIIVPVDYVEQGLGKLTGATFENSRNMIFVLRTLNPDDSQIVYATFALGAGTVKAGTSVSMTQVDSGSLPAALPDKAGFVGPAFTMTATDPENNTLTETLLTNQIKIKLVDGYSVPEGQKLSVQVYANGVWTALDTTVSGQFVYAYTNLLGTFLLTTIPQ